MGQEEAQLPAPATAAFSWEHERGVPKPVSTQSPRKAPAAAVFSSWEHEQGTTTTKPALKPRGVPEKAQAQTRRLSAPPGRPAPRGVSRAVRPEDDPFLAAYLACTRSAGGDGGKRGTTAKGAQRRLTWTGIGLRGLSCRRGGGAVERSMVRLPKLPEADPRDD